MTAALEGCIPTSVTVTVVVDTALVVPRLDVVHAVDDESASTRRCALATGSHSFLSPSARMEVYVDDDTEGAAVAIVDADTGDELWRCEDLVRGWADVSGVLDVLMGSLRHHARGAQSIRVIASAPGCRDSVAGPFGVTMDYTCTAPRFVEPLPPSDASFSTVYMLSAGPPLEVLVPDGGGDESTSRGLLFVALCGGGGGGSGGGDDDGGGAGAGDDGGALLLAVPDATGIARVQVTPALHGRRAVLRHRRIGCGASAPLEFTLLVDKPLEPPVVTAWPTDGSDGRELALAAANATHVLSSEVLEVGCLDVPGARVVLRCEGCVPVTLDTFPVRMCAMPGAGPRRVTLAAEARGVVCPAPCVLEVDASPSAAPVLTSHTLRPATPLFVASSDALSFSAPASNYPGAQIQVRTFARAREAFASAFARVLFWRPPRWGPRRAHLRAPERLRPGRWNPRVRRRAQVTLSALALPVLVPHAAAPRLDVRALFSAPLLPGTEVSVAVREVAPGCLPGPLLQFTVVVDHALPTAALDAASGMVLGGTGRPLVLFGSARLTLSHACAVPDAALVVTLTSAADGASGAGGAPADGDRVDVRVPVPSGTTELWVSLPTDVRWSVLTVGALETPGCAPRTAPLPPVPIRVEVTTAPGYLARAAGVDESVEGLLVAAGFTTIWQLRLLDQAAAEAAGVVLGDWFMLEELLRPLQEATAPLAPPALPGAVTPVWRFVSHALRGVDRRVLETIANFFEALKLNSDRTLAALAAQATGNRDAAERSLARDGVILPGYRASLLAALRDGTLGAMPAAMAPGGGVRLDASDSARAASRG